MKTYTQEEVDDLLDRQASEITAQILKQKDTYSREEVINLMEKAWIFGEANQNQHHSVRINWIKQNLK